MLPDHPPPRVAEVDVVRDPLARGDQNLPDAWEHLGCHLSEPPGIDRFASGRDPGAIALVRAPPLGVPLGGLAHLKLQLQAPRLACHVPHTVKQLR